MPIGFSDLLKTTAQLDNNLTKGIVNTDETYGGVRSKIDDWTDLHLSTFNSGAGRTFQDDGTAASPGHFKPYSTLFYVADGRALIETNTAEGAIRLNSSGEFVSSGGQLYTHDSSGTAEPEYWVYIDATAVGGTGTGTDKLPKFTITGTQGDGSTALPAGYQKLQVLTNAAPSTGAVSLSSDLNNNLLSNTNGELGLDNQNANVVFAGPGSGGAAAPAFRGLVSADIPNNAANTTGSADTLGTGRTLKVDLTSTSASTAFDGSANITDIGVSGTLPVANGGTGLTSLATLLNANVTASTLGLVIGSDVQAFDAQLSDIAGLTPTDSHFIVGNGSNFVTETGGTARTSLGLGSIATQNANNVDIDGGAIDGTTIGANTAAAGSFTTITASSNVTISGNLTVAGDVSQQNSTEVNFNDTRLRLNIPSGLLDGSIENTNAPTANTNVGLEIFNGATGGAFSNGPLWVYNYNTDKWGASIQGSVGTLDNVTAMKFDRTLTGLGTDNADVADLYGSNSSAVSNDETARSLGGVSRCRITITTESTDGVNNFAPVTAAAVGYPIAHNLGTKAVFVVAIKDPDGTPIPVHCKYQPKTTNVCVVSVGITAEDEVYDIIVIG